MNVKLIKCGAVANESEQRAFLHIENLLRSTAGDDEWVLLCNLMFSVNHQLQSEEIDLVAIGPPGVTVIEIKHWSGSWIRDQNNQTTVENEADLLMRKTKKIATTLRRHFADLPKVNGYFLLTTDSADNKKLRDYSVRGVSFYSLAEAKQAIGLSGQSIFRKGDCRGIAKLLEPKSCVHIDGTLRRFAGLINLEKQSADDECFHRIYKGLHPVRQDNVILHLYDLSASDEKNPERRARREYEALRELQLYRWAPRILDSFQEYPHYPGEMFFFTVVDPSAPTIANRGKDEVWTPHDRAVFVFNAINALKELHSAGKEGAGIIHRKLTPETLLVKYDNSVILTGFDMTRLHTASSITLPAPDHLHWQQTIAPEVLQQGFSAADKRSDIYALCKSLIQLFEGKQDDLSCYVVESLEYGSREKPEDRVGLDDLEKMFSRVVGEDIATLPAPHPRYWSEGQVISFRDHHYRIINRIGSGGIGIMFKVVEINRDTDEEFGTYVAKVINEEECGKITLRSYTLARSHVSRHSGLSMIYETSAEWEENNFVALMTWIDGMSLSEFRGVVPLLAEDIGEDSPESLVIRWYIELLESLDILHRNGLVHGDVSPGNIIISNGSTVLTDYDFVTRIGEKPHSPGTVICCEGFTGSEQTAQPSNDLFALAATIFHVIYDRDPFFFDGNRYKNRGMNWTDIKNEEYKVIREVLQRSTHPDPKQRFQSAREILKVLALVRTNPEIGSVSDMPITRITDESPSPRMAEQTSEWLRMLLQSYPGSQWGNSETRGLDTLFAEETYVETGLEIKICENILSRRVRLVILCGNAGDGKTALLQYVARKLECGTIKSSDRVIEHRMKDGLLIRINLDGSAAWKGKSSDEVLNDFLAPFHKCNPVGDICHLLAINDGRLLEWIENADSSTNTDFEQLHDVLLMFLDEGEYQSEFPIHFINLNHRSLVGGIDKTRTSLSTAFLDLLIDRLYGGSTAGERWQHCQRCSAQGRCEVFRTMLLFGPEKLTIQNRPESVIRMRARSRLFSMLQAIHFRGEVHITTRELRAALVFILFGTHFCNDYHEGHDANFLPYWDRVFDPLAQGRQGDVLRELARLDPALESHPKIDRYVQGLFVQQSPGPEKGFGLTLGSARRRAYFECTERQCEEIAGDKNAITLARGQHLEEFLSLGFEDNQHHKKNNTLRKLCRGISRLEDIPPQALSRPDVVPLRISPRTPTETTFWTEKPLTGFSLEADLPAFSPGLDRLHRQVRLAFSYRDGTRELLIISQELFHLLLELSEGYQLGDVSTDDTFAHLSIFIQRLTREDETEMFALIPLQENTVYRVFTRLERHGGSIIQKLCLSTLSEEVKI